jgi:ketosteroid isomerase-like protein
MVPAALLVTGAAPASWQQRTLASARPFINRANTEWTHAIVTGEADVMSAPYDDKGMFIGPDGSVTRGRDAVRRMYATRRHGVRVLHASIRGDGLAAHDPNNVYEWGTAWMTIRDSHGAKTRSGKYLTVWHREGKEWKITHNIAF